MAKKIDVYGELNSRTGDGKLADASQIWDSTQGKFQDEINQETANDGLVSVKVEQEFTDEEKAQGRENIGAASQEDVDDKIEEIEEDLQDYARKDGSYEQMIVGGAMNLAGQTVEVNSEMYHPTGVEHASGVAEVRGIKGNTVAWNQQVQNGNFADGTTGWSPNRGTISAADNIMTFVGDDTTNTSKGFQSQDVFFITTGHKYYNSFEIKGDFDNLYVTHNFSSGNNSILQILSSSDSNPNAFVRKSSIINFEGDSYNFRVSIRWVDAKNEGGTIQCKNIMIIDLTLIYGAGNEPSTAEQFEADYFKWLGKPLAYEEYDEGSLRSVNMAAYKTTGFNQWDEEWLNGYWNFYVGGAPFSPDSNQMCTKNFIRSFPSTTYYISIPNKTGKDSVLCFDENMNFIGRVVYSYNNSFTTLQRTYYIKINFGEHAGTTYNHDICINISNAERNGEYEPYEVHSYPMPVTTLKGKLNGEGASVVVFPDGMKSAGTIHDEIFISGGKTYGIKRVGAVDLGSLTWRYYEYGGNPGGYVNGFEPMKAQMSAEYPNIACGKIESYPDTIFNTNNLTTQITASIGKMIKVSYPNVSDASTLKAAMNGVILYYELATPEIYEIDDFSLPQNILVDSDGTEEVINAQGKENDSVAPYIDMIYSINAVGALNNLPQGYISEKSMDNFLARLSSAMGGTWTKTWNSTLKEWEFTFTPSANTNSLTQNNEEA